MDHHTEDVASENITVPINLNGQSVPRDQLQNGVQFFLYQDINGLQQNQEQTGQKIMLQNVYKDQHRTLKHVALTIHQVIDTVDKIDLRHEGFRDDLEKFLREHEK